MPKYQLHFKLENLPGVGSVNQVAGECEASTPFEAGQKLECFLQARIGKNRFRYLTEAKIVDSDGRDSAYLQIDTLYKKVEELTCHVPAWGRWLTVH